MRYTNYDAFHRFLTDEYFDGRGNDGYRALQPLEQMAPHDIYRLKKGDLSRTVRGIGAKREAVILQIIEEYKPVWAMCSCGEPILEWYQFCPCCSKEVSHEC